MVNMFSHILSVFSVAVFGLLSGQCLCATEADATKELILPVSTCKRDLPDYFTCLKRAIQKAWPRFIDGLPEFDFPPFDPLWIEYYRETYTSGELNAEVTVTNMTILGYKTAKFVNVKSEFLEKAFRLVIAANIPDMYIDGHIKGEGRLAGLKMGGQGHFNLTGGGIKIEWDINGQVRDDRLTVEHVYLKLEVNKLKIYFNDLFENKELNDFAVKFVNDNWLLFYRLILPVTAKSVDQWCTKVSNRIFSKVSFSKLFP